MKAEVVSMSADNLDMEAIRRGGDILKQGTKKSLTIHQR